MEYDRLKRDALTKQESDRNTMSNLTSEIKNIRAQYDDTWSVQIFGLGGELYFGSQTDYIHAE